MKPQKQILILFAGVLAGVVGLAGLEEAAARKREPSYWVKKVRVEQNIIFDDRSLAPVVDLRGGIKMTPGIMELLAAEVEGFYSSHGHFLVKAEIPKKRPRHGVLKLRVNETEDILAGNGEEERAKREVEKLIRSARLQIDAERKNEVVERLVQGYRTFRLTRLDARRRAAAEKARREEEKRAAAVRQAEKAPPQTLKPAAPADDRQAANGERKRARQEVEKLIRTAGLQVSVERKNAVIEKLARGYRALRLAKAATRRRAAAAKARREEEKRAAAAPRQAEKKPAKAEGRAAEKPAVQAEPAEEQPVVEVKGEEQAALPPPKEEAPAPPLNLTVTSERGKKLVLRNVRFGYFKTLSPGKVSPGGRGKFKDTVNNVEDEIFRFVERDKIPLVIGDAFGVQWDVPEIGAADVLVLQKKWELPPVKGRAGKGENALELKAVYRNKGEAVINRWKFQDYKGFNLPGKWTLSFYNKGKLLISKTFTVYKPGEEAKN